MTNNGRREIAEEAVTGDPSQAAKPPGSFRATLRFKDFRLLLASLATSGIGDWFYNVALIVLVLRQTDSPAWVAAASIARLAPYALFGTVGGALADRYDRRRVMVISDLVRAALMFMLTVAALTSAPIIVAIAIAFLSTAAGTPFFPAVAAATPSVVDETHLASANGLITTIDSLAIAVGPALGGLALALGPPAVAFSVNGATFLASAYFLSRSRKTASRILPMDETPQPWTRQLRDGVDAMRSAPGVVVLIVLSIVAAFTYGQEVVLYPLVAKDLLGIGEEGVGFLFAAIGVGGILGAGLTNRLAHRPRTAPVLVIGSLFAASPLLLLPFVADPPPAYVLVAIEGASCILVDVLVTTLLQRAIPPNLTARVFGILDSLGVAGTIAGALLAPLVLEAIGIEGALITAGAILIGLTLLCVPRLRAVDRQTEERRVQLGTRADLLDKVALFSGMSRTALEALGAAVTELRVDRGSVVIREGDNADDLFVVVSGHLDVMSSGEEGGEQSVVNHMGPGDHFGEIGLLERIPRTASVQTTTECHLYRVGGQDFLDSVRTTPSVSRALFAGMAPRLSRTHPSYRPTSHEESP